jgi:hypothetical protein
MKDNTRYWRGLAVVVSLMIGLLGLAPSAFGQGKTSQRSIQDFLGAQGTFCLPDGVGGCVVFLPPVDNFVGWGDPKNGNLASVDYAGLANRWIETASGGTRSLGTTFAGIVLERLLADGRVEVTVTLRTENALIFVAQTDFATGPLVFGHRAPEVLAGASPVLAHTTFHISFTNTAPGAPLPDLMQLFFAPLTGQAFSNYSFHAEAHDGSASATVTQTGNAARTNIQAAIVKVK